MRILAIETATWTCSVALWRDGAVVAERSERTTSSHASTLPTLVEAMFGDTGEKPVRGDAVAVSIGPGSFTGLRIGLSFAKGLAFSAGLVLVGVPTLDAYALAVPPRPGTLCIALDARKQEVYAAVYASAGGRVMRVGETRSMTASRLGAELAEALRSGALDGPVQFVGDGAAAYAETFRECLGADAIVSSAAEHPTRATTVARLAVTRLAREPRGDDLVTLAPVYLRPPAAELKQSVVAPTVATDDGLATASRHDVV